MDGVLEKLVVIIDAQTKDLEKSMSSTKKEFDKLQKTAGKVTLGIVAGATAAAGAMFGWAKSTSDTASAIDDASKKVGFGAEEYQKWAFAAEQSGIEAGTLETLMKKQQTVFADAAAGSEVARKAYQDLGIDISNMTASGAFEAVVMQLADMSDETERNRIANDLFGRSYADLLPLLAEGGTGIDELRQKAVDLGAVMSNEAVASGEAFGDSLGELEKAVNGVWNEIGTALLPYFQDIVNWILENKDEIKKFATDVIDKIAGAFDWFAKNRKTVVPAIEAMGLALLTASNPLAALVAGIGLLAVNWNNMSQMDKIIGVLGLLAAAAAAAAIAVGALQSAWSLGIAAAAIVAGILAITYAINNAKPKTQNASGAVGGGGGSRFAKGGFPDAGSMFLAGEDGPELLGSFNGKTTVLPLENTSFVSAMKDAVVSGVTQAMANQPQGNSTLVVDGMILAKAVENNLNKLSTAQGGLNIAF